MTTTKTITTKTTTTKMTTKATTTKTTTTKATTTKAGAASKKAVTTSQASTTLSTTPTATSSKEPLTSVPASATTTTPKATTTTTAFRQSSTTTACNCGAYEAEIAEYENKIRELKERCAQQCDKKHADLWQVEDPMRVSLAGAEVCHCGRYSEDVQEFEGSFLQLKQDHGNCVSSCTKRNEVAGWTRLVAMGLPLHKACHVVGERLSTSSLSCERLHSIPDFLRYLA